MTTGLKPLDIQEASSQLPLCTFSFICRTNFSSHMRDKNKKLLSPKGKIDVPLGPNLLGSCTSGCPRQILGASFLPADSGVTREVCDVQDFLGPWQAYSHAQSSVPWAIADSEQGLLNIACRQKCTLISWNLVGFTFARSRKSRRDPRWKSSSFFKPFCVMPLSVLLSF